MAAGAAAAVSGGSSLLSGWMNSRSSKKAAKQLEQGAADARGAYTRGSENSRKVLTDEYWKARNEDFSDYTSAGGEAVTRLKDLVLNDDASIRPGYEKYKEFQFDRDSFKTDPGYEFRLAEGQKALERSAAAKGGLSTSGKALTRYAQGYASDEYDKVYGRALDEYKVNRGTFDMNQIGSERVAGTKYSQLSDLANLGYSATRDRSSASGRFAEDISRSLEDEGRYVGETYMDAANARASGTVGSGNAWSNAFTTIGDLGTRYAASKWGKPRTAPPAQTPPQPYTGYTGSWGTGG